MCMSVYFARSAERPGMRGSRWPDRQACGRRGPPPSRSPRPKSRRPRPRSPRVVPCIRLDADEMCDLARLQKGQALAHHRVADDRAGLGARMVAGGVKGRADGCDVVAVDAQDVPAESCPFVGHPLGRQHLGRGAIGLLIVEIDQADQVRQPLRRDRQRGPPRRTLARFAIGTDPADR